MKSKKSSLPDVDSKEKQTLIMTIRKYQDNQRFKKFVTKDLGVNDTYGTLNKKSISTLKDILERIRVNLDNRNVDKMLDAMAKNGSVVYEKVLSSWYDIDGFTDNLFSQESFLDCLEKVKIETNLPRIPPSVQMGYIVLQTTLLTHELNKSKKPKTEMEGPPDFEDLVITDEN